MCPSFADPVAKRDEQMGNWNSRIPQATTREKKATTTAETQTACCLFGLSRILNAGRKRLTNGNLHIALEFISLLPSLKTLCDKRAFSQSNPS